MATCDKCNKKVPESKLVSIPGFRICPSCDKALEQDVLGSFAAVTRISSGPSGTGKEEGDTADAVGGCSFILAIIPLITAVWWKPFGHLGIWIKLLLSVGSLVVAGFLAWLFYIIAKKITG